MSITIKTRTWLLILVALFLATFFSGWYMGCSRADRANNAIVSSMAKEISRYEIEVNDANLYIAEKDQEISSLKVAIDIGIVGREYIRKLHLKAIDEVIYKQAQIDILIDSINHISSPCENFDDVDDYNIVIKEVY